MCPAARPGLTMASASSAPPKKIVAPTVSQINAEYVTQVRPAAQRSVGVSGPPLRRQEPGAGKAVPAAAPPRVYK